MMSENFADLVRRGIEECEAGNTTLALMYLEKASRKDRKPILDSYLGYCLARVRRNVHDGVSLCSLAVKAEPGNLIHYRNLARVYIAAGQRKNAFETLRKARKTGRDEEVAEMMKTMGIRKEPVIRFLPRSNAINIILGKLRHRMFN